MSLAEALATTLKDRMRRTDLSAWQKASDVAEFQGYLRVNNQPHSTRDLAKLLEIPQTRVAEQLTIATGLDTASLARYGLVPGDLMDSDHRALLRVAKLPHYLRDKPLRDLSKAPDAAPLGATTGAAVARERRRESVFAKLRDEGQLLIEIPHPIVSLSVVEARTYLDEFLPALAHLAEIVKGSNRSHYIGVAGNGGIVIYLSPLS